MTLGILGKSNVLSKDCDTEINSPGALADASGCNVPCTGDNSQSCGGADRIFVAHKIGGVATTPTPTQPSIKQTVGSWEYQGCFTDLGFTRILLHEFTVSSNSAEICTSACGANGYPLAGLEFAGECFCDTYMPFGEKRPDSECFMTCTGDPAELCGAGNRLALYADSVATPPSPTSCVGLRAPGSPFFARSIDASFVATDLNPGSTGLRIYLKTPEPHDPAVTPLFHILSVSIELLFSPLGSAPTVGESPVFVTNDAGVPRYTQFCAHPQPHSPAGPFVGFPVLAVDGRSDLWAICANQTQNGRLDVVYSPVPGHPHYDISDCTQMYLQLVPEYALPPS
ncbi:WSC domain-containing protein [Collybia nuda]|uniref:WSC domain-containing protein n=1 Tax=Collybia nuda TaxID=64659 RepID=A0A9P6CGE5_9AGAR|nr:WSC domain-containing protein [Collybia nuda]